MFKERYLIVCLLYFLSCIPIHSAEAVAGALPDGKEPAKSSPAVERMEQTETAAVSPENETTTESATTVQKPQARKESADSEKETVQTNSLNSPAAIIQTDKRLIDALSALFDALTEEQKSDKANTMINVYCQIASYDNSALNKAVELLPLVSDQKAKNNYDSIQYWSIHTVLCTFITVKRYDEALKLISELRTQRFPFPKDPLFFAVTEKLIQQKQIEWGRSVMAQWETTRQEVAPGELSDGKNDNAEPDGTSTEVGTGKGAGNRQLSDQEFVQEEFFEWTVAIFGINPIDRSSSDASTEEQTEESRQNHLFADSIDCNLTAAQLYAGLGQKDKTLQRIHTAQEWAKRYPDGSIKLEALKQIASRAIICREFDAARSIAQSWRELYQESSSWAAGKAFRCRPIERSLIDAFVQVDEDDLARETAIAIPYTRNRNEMGVSTEPFPAADGGVNDYGFSDDVPNEKYSNDRLEYFRIRQRLIKDRKSNERLLKTKIQTREIKRRRFAQDDLGMLKIYENMDDGYKREDVLRDIINICLDKGKLDAAMKLAPKIQFDDTKSSVYASISSALIKADRLPEAIDWLEKYRNPYQKFGVYCLAANEAAQRGQLEEAGKLVDRALAIEYEEPSAQTYAQFKANPESFAAFRYLTIIPTQILLTRFDDARESLQKSKSSIQSLKALTQPPDSRVNSYAELFQTMEKESFLSLIEALQDQLKLLEFEIQLLSPLTDGTGSGTGSGAGQTNGAASAIPLRPDAMDLIVKSMDNPIGTLGLVKPTDLFYRMITRKGVDSTLDCLGKALPPKYQFDLLESIYLRISALLNPASPSGEDPDQFRIRY